MASSFMQSDSSTVGNVVWMLPQIRCHSRAVFDQHEKGGGNQAGTLKIIVILFMSPFLESFPCTTTWLLTVVIFPMPRETNGILKYCERMALSCLLMNLSVTSLYQHLDRRMDLADQQGTVSMLSIYPSGSRYLIKNKF